MNNGMRRPDFFFCFSIKPVVADDIDMLLTLLSAVVYQAQVADNGIEDGRVTNVSSSSVSIFSGPIKMKLLQTSS